MIAIKINDKYLDLLPGTTIQRERNSPFFLSRESGKDGIPAEVSFPFTLPLSDRNMRILGYTDHLPSIKPKIFDNILFDDINQLSSGKMQMRNTELSLNQSGVGKQEANLLCNSSAFAKAIEGKKLKDLTLGGPRTFTWDGYNITTGTGFWKHCHDTWNHTNCDDGDYVFFPVHDSEYGGESFGPNSIQWVSASSRVELTRNQNVTSLCPHIFYSYILRCIFQEHGYTLYGDILDDPMFKKMCLISFRGVYWSELNKYTGLLGRLLKYYVPAPFSSITIKLSEHVPQDVGVGEFLVELCKFLPIGLDINDNARTCTLRLLGRPSAPSSIKDVTGKISPIIQANRNDTEGKNKKFGIRRNFNTDSLQGGVADITNLNFPAGREQNWLPLPAPVLSGEAFRLIFDNGYWAKEKIENVYTSIRLGDNLHSYEPDGATDFIESNLAPVSTRNNVAAVINGSDWNYRLPHCNVEGNWYGKPTAVPFGMHVCFYQGKNYPLTNNNARLAPYASSTNNRWVTGASEEVPQIFGTWSMGMELGGYGMVEVWWAEWLKILAEAETMKATLVLDIVDYLKLRWSDELLVENTSYFVKKITEILPYPGKVDIEAVRWIKGNT